MKIKEYFTKNPHKILKDKEILLDYSQPLKELYYLDTGFIAMYAQIGGDELLVHIFTEGSVLPLINYATKTLNQYLLKSIGVTKVYRVSEEKFEELLISNPTYAVDYLKRIMAGMDKLVRRIGYIAFADAEEKIISTLTYLQKTFPDKKSPNKISRKFTHAEIAGFAGISRETVTRIFEQLKNNKIISINSDNTISIKLKK